MEYAAIHHQPVQRWLHCFFLLTGRHGVQYSKIPDEKRLMAEADSDWVWGDLYE